MYERLKGLFDRGLLDSAKLRVAVTKGWIDEVEFKEITGEVY